MRPNIGLLLVGVFLLESLSFLIPRSGAFPPLGPLDPPPYMRLLAGEDAKQVEALEKEIEKLWAAGQFQEGLGPARRALAIRLRVQGKRHWQTADAQHLLQMLDTIAALPAEARAEVVQATALSKEAGALSTKGRYAEAIPLRQRALELVRNHLGEDDGETAAAMNEVAVLFLHVGRYAEAMPLLIKALAIKRRALGEGHPETATSYSNLAASLNAQGQYAEAAPLYEKALTICRAALGDDDPSTAASYNNLAANLNAQGQYAEAAPLYEKALAIKRQALGEDAPDTALSYNSLAHNLEAQGKYAEAAPLLEKALAICRRALGEDHPDTAQSYNNLASNLNNQGRYAEAAPLYEKALAICRRALGEGHRHTAVSYNNLAYNLYAQGKYAAAMPLYEQALAIRRRALGDDHPDTALGYKNLAHNLKAQGKYAEAAPLYEKALAIRCRALGEDHPDTAQSYSNVASNLNAQGQYAEAERFWVRATGAFEVARWRSNVAGLDRAAFAAARGSPFFVLTACLVRNQKPGPAWQSLEAGLARGLLDEVSERLAVPLRPADQQRQQHLTQRLDDVDRAIRQILFAKEKTAAGQAQLQDLLRERQAVEEDLARWNAERTARAVYDRARIQAALAPDAALIAWVDVGGERDAADPDGEHWACVLRHSGPPAWVKLPGRGPKGAWTEDDEDLPSLIRQTLANRPGTFREGGPDLLRRLAAQRLTPLEPYLKASVDLPAVQQLVVLPAGWMAGIPVEALTDRYTVSYAPSGTLFARLQEKRRQAPTEGDASAPPRLLALGDPVFPRPTGPTLVNVPPPDHGLLLTLVQAGSAAAQAGLKDGDVLLRYADQKLTKADDLRAAVANHPEDPSATNARAAGGLPIQVWRDGQVLALTIRPGRLGVQFSLQPAAEAVRARREADRVVQASRGGAFQPLPGTRAEIQAVAALFPQSMPLLGSEASEQCLDDLAFWGRLKGFRYLHLATHGDVNFARPLESALILAQDQLPDPIQQRLAGKTVYTGRLTAAAIRESWQLDAELVTLSACDSGLGRNLGGEGFLGFTQALLLAGARSLVLSLWKVDDTATALLMERFYQNLLGKRDGLTKPLPKAEALREAKAWLRTLTSQDAEQQRERLAALAGEGVELPPLPVGERPFAHPYYWSAFILIGDPN